MPEATRTVTVPFGSSVLSPCVGTEYVALLALAAMVTVLEPSSVAAT